MAFFGHFFSQYIEKHVKTADCLLINIWMASSYQLFLHDYGYMVQSNKIGNKFYVTCNLHYFCPINLKE